MTNEIVSSIIIEHLFPGMSLCEGHPLLRKIEKCADEIIGGENYHTTGSDVEIPTHTKGE